MYEDEVVEVLQREIGITRSTDSKPILATTNVEMCVVLHGINEEQKVGFMCHFDFPFNTKSLSDLASKLSEITGKNSKYKCEIYGGKHCTWARSPRIRELIKQQAEKLKNSGVIDLQIVYESDLLKCREKLAYAIDTRNFKIRPYPQRNVSLSLKRLLKIDRPIFIHEPTTNDE